MYILGMFAWYLYIVYYILGIYILPLTFESRVLFIIASPTKVKLLFIITSIKRELNRRPMRESAQMNFFLFFFLNVKKKSFRN
jgi:hypothetical protein